MNYLAAQFPLAMALGLPVIDAGPGFDELEVEEKLGSDRFTALTKGLTRVFCSNHAKYADTVPGSHRIAGYERHCIYAEDLERFLAQEGK